MTKKETLIVLDFDGFLINSYKLLQITFEHFGLDIGDEDRFKHRRKFLKYLGGGKEFLGNLVSYSLPKKKKIRQILTEIYQEEGRIYPEFVLLLNGMIENPAIHVGIISRNFTHNPGKTIRTVLGNSGVEEQHLDFVIPIDIGVKKRAVLEGMKSSRYLRCLFAADEVGDFKAAVETGYDTILMGSYGFDNAQRLIQEGDVPPEIVYNSPAEIAEALEQRTFPEKFETPALIASFQY